LHDARNFYFCIDRDSGLMNMIPWDCNMSFGGYHGGAGAWARELKFQVFNGRRPLVSVLWTVGSFRQRFYAHVRTILDESYKWDAVMKANNDRYQALIDAAVRADPYRQYPYSYFRDNLTKDVDSATQYGILPGMKTLVDRRRQYLLNDVQVKKPTPVITGVEFPSAVTVPGQAVWVRAKVTASTGVKQVTLHTADVPHATFAVGSMYDDGKHRDGLANDGVYGGSFPAAEAFEEKRFYVRGTANNFTQQFHPRHTENEPLILRTIPIASSGPIVINELLADNDQGDVDKKGENEDWVELINTGSVAYDLTGHYLSDDIHDRKQWPFPAGTSIPAGGFLRVWCDNEPADGPLHATFKLSDGGEEVFLVDTDARGNKVLDGVLFDEQSSDRSFGSVPDASVDAFYLWSPSGGAPVTGTGLGRAVRFDPRRKANPSGMDLKTNSVPRVAYVLDLQVVNGAPMSSGLLGVALGVWHIDLGVLGPLLLDPAAMVLVPVSLDAGGTGRVVTPPLPANTLGLTVYAQALVGDFSNALAIRISN
ncbi:MAG: lamin tail domain-containing protein, partial [Planctomycetota bacterium]|nr:lamin tail domain-containing protein [Planctomycetota bacterium]